MNRPSEHKKAQKQIKELQSYQCSVCGKIDKAEGHHLIPYSEGGSSDLPNMITMCQDCHRKYHRGELKIDISRF